MASSAEPSVEALVAGVLAADRGALARAITLVESTRADHAAQARALLAALAPRSDRAQRVGITGVPGAGKSTLIEVLGVRLLQSGHRVAVLAVDPTSTRSGGSVLGDKTRMAKLAADARAFVRPSPSGDAAGGVARRTREAIQIVEAAGFDIVLVETVGVGQAEIAVTHLVDTVVALNLAGTGDELQGVKRGLMELADVLVVHKADGDNVDRCTRAAGELQTAQHLLHQAGDRPPAAVVSVSSATGDGIEDLWSAITAHRDRLGPDGIDALRRQQAVHWFDQTVVELLLREAHQDAGFAAALPALREQVGSGALEPTAAAQALLSTRRAPDGAADQPS